MRRGGVPRLLRSAIRRYVFPQHRMGKLGVARATFVGAKGDERRRVAAPPGLPEGSERAVCGFDRILKEDETEWAAAAEDSSGDGGLVVQLG